MDTQETFAACEVDKDPERFLNRTFVVRTAIWNSAHGLYQNDADCPDAAIWFATSPSAEKALYQSVLAAANDNASVHNSALFKVRAEMADYQLPLTNQVSPRFRLTILEVISK